MFVEVTIKGVSSLLMNRFPDGMEDTSQVNKGERGTPRQQAEKALYRLEDGRLYLPGANIYAAIIGAGIFHKAGKSKVTTQKSSLVPAGVWIMETAVPFKGNQWEVDSRRCVIPATGGSIIRHRPRLDEWELTFTLEIDPGMFSEKFVRELVDDAGKKVGLGDFRPARKGPMGRFVVTNWKKVEMKKAA